MLHVENGCVGAATCPFGGSRLAGPNGTLSLLIGVLTIFLLEI